MNDISNGEKAAHDDLFVSAALIGIGLYASNINWVESDWLGLFGTVMLTAFGGLLLAVRTYHLTHKDEVFGVRESSAKKRDNHGFNHD